jgi:hypothetical protein
VKRNKQSAGLPHHGQAGALVFTTLKLEGCERMTIPQPTLKAKYCTVYDEPCRIVKVSTGLIVVYDDGRIEDYALEMAPFMVVLGDCTTADLQALDDRLAGGAAAIACTRAN